MNREYISNTVIKINTLVSKIWNVLVTQEMVKEYFFGANIEYNWKENSSIVFNEEYNVNKYLEKGILMNVTNV